MEDTIFALASAPGRAGVAVVRVSGRAARQAVQTLTGKPLPAPRRAVLRRLRYAGTEIDQALLLWFEAPASFTGEDVAEFQIHGGAAVREALFAAWQVWVCARPVPGNSAAARWKMAGSISPGPRRSPIWWRPRPRLSCARRYANMMARLPNFMKAGGGN